MTGTQWSSGFSPGTRSAEEAHGWLASLCSLFTVPPECPDLQLDRREALTSLRCGDAILDLLIQEGLQSTGLRGQEMFKRSDLFNLALYSGSGHSEAEIAVRFALRWMSASPDELCAPALWSFDVELGCGCPIGCGDGPRWLLARPHPEAFGGRIVSLTVNPPGADRRGRDFAVAQDEPVRVEAIVETRGEVQTIRSPQLRSIVDEFRARGLRYARLPPPVQWDFDRLLPAGVTTCYAASMHLEQRCRSAGLRARTRRGWILGMLDLPHAWLEVEDSDGAIKVIDPVFALLSEQLAPSPHPSFADLCMGSKLNRVLPSDHRADEPLILHWCGGRQRLVRSRVQVRLIGDSAATPIGVGGAR